MTGKRSHGASGISPSSAKNAPLKVGVAVAGAAAAALTLILTVGAIWLWQASQTVTPEATTQNGRGHHGVGRWQDRVIDLGKLVPLMVTLAVVAIVFMGLFAWWVTRKANQPMEQALRIQQGFVQDASHELRTPLSTLNSRIQLAERRLASGGDTAETLSHARRDIDVMNDVLSDLLAAAEATPLGTGNATSEVEAACADALRLVSAQATGREVHLVSHVPSGLTVKAEQTGLVRALVALLDNAIGYSPAGGTVMVTATKENSVGKKWVALRVADQGSGIPPEDQQRIFQRFARAASPGTRKGSGLGLALVQDIATRFGGTIDLENTSSSGTTFILRLPA